MTYNADALTEMMQKEIDSLRAQVKALEEQLATIGQICKPYMPV